MLSMDCLLLCGLLAILYVPVEPSACYHFYAKYLSEDLNATIRGQQPKCHSNFCWRVHVSFDNGQQTSEDQDILEGGCLNDCGLVGNDNCLYGDEIPPIKVYDSQVYTRDNFKHAKAKAFCCCHTDLCNASVRTYATVFIILINTLFSLSFC